MKFSLLITGISVMFIACNQEKEKQISLSGTTWKSYQNRYFFLTDSTGFSQDGQFLWSTPVEPDLYNSSEDSVAYDDNEIFNYALRDTILTINYISCNQGKRIFYKHGDGLFISEQEYTYGREGIELDGKIK
jgi:hypothetical protein